MDISNTWMPLILKSVDGAMRYKQMLLQSDTLKNREDHEESLVYLGELLEYLKDEYAKHQKEFKFTPEQILGEK